MKIIKLALLSATLIFSTVSLAEMKIAVVNIEQALTSTSAWKRADSQVTAQLSSSENRFKQLQSELRALQIRAQKEADILSAKDRAKLEYDIKTKAAEYQEIMAKSERVRGEALQNLMKELQPKAQKAVDAIIKEKGYDLVLNAQSVIHVAEAYDITEEVTKRLNK